MTRLTTTPAIFGILVGGMAAGLVGCGANTVAIGQQNVDAAAGRDAPLAGSAAGATGAGGVASTGGTVGAGGTVAATGAGGTLGTGGASSTGKMCGGFAGLPCAAGEICEIAAGHCCCDYLGTCVAQPQVCSMIYAPVCGCDGKTYPSDCERQGAGVSKDFDGPCATADAGAGGSTGTGGSTGAGGSKGSGGATGAGGSKGTGGATATGGTGGSTGKTCGGIAGLLCATDEFCEMSAGSCSIPDATGICMAKVKAGNCPIFAVAPQPVCGCDGKTYYDDCERQVAGVSKQSNGACPSTDAGTGGRGGTGGATGTGGTAGSGGNTGTGGTGGSTGKTCGGFAGLLCAAGEFCETPAGSCNEPEGSGNCAIKPQVCSTLSQPVCGCDGKTYPNDCYRLAFGASKSHDGACATDGGQDVGPAFDALSPAALCTATGGTVSSSLCCSATADFPNSCLVGACGCAPDYSHTISTCDCTTGCFLPGYGCVGPANICTVGNDQTCNDNLALNSFRGRCVADGRCVCGLGAPLASGKCP
jgi:hypothetical protein